jgi:hypothetical protein
MEGARRSRYRPHRSDLGSKCVFFLCLIRFPLSRSVYLLLQSFSILRRVPYPSRASSLEPAIAFSRRDPQARHRHA